MLYFTILFSQIASIFSSSVGDHDTVVVDKVNLVVFFCHTFTVASQLKKKNVRIKKAVGRFLDMGDVKADRMNALQACEWYVNNDSTIGTDFPLRSKCKCVYMKWEYIYQMVLR